MEIWGLSNNRVSLRIVWQSHFNASGIQCVYFFQFFGARGGGGVVVIIFLFCFVFVGVPMGVCYSTVGGNTRVGKPIKMVKRKIIA